MTRFENTTVDLENYDIGCENEKRLSSLNDAKNFLPMMRWLSHKQPTALLGLMPRVRGRDYGRPLLQRDLQATQHSTDGLETIRRECHDQRKSARPPTKRYQPFYERGWALPVYKSFR